MSFEKNSETMQVDNSTPSLSNLKTDMPFIKRVMIGPRASLSATREFVDVDKPRILRALLNLPTLDHSEVRTNIVIL
jgi:hypothetical protein